MNVEILSDNPVSPNFASGKASLACSYPLSTLLDDGSIVCVYRQGTTKHSSDGILLMQVSHDNGKTWNSPKIVFDGQKLEPRQTAEIGGPCQNTEGSLLIVYSTVESLPEDVYMFSEEGEKLPRKLWITEKRLDDSSCQSSREIVLQQQLDQPGITAKPLVLKNGRICLPVEYKASNGIIGTALFFSQDQGKSFGSFSSVAVDHSAEMNWCDARFNCLEDGRLIGLLWTFLQENERTVEVHQTFSSDEGQTWTRPQKTGFVGQITAPLALSNGHLIAASNYRCSPEGIRLWTSLNEGTQWDLRTSIQMWDSTCGSMLGNRACNMDKVGGKDAVWEELPNFTFGTPDLLLLDDGCLLLSYYATLESIIHVRACRFRINW